MRKSPCGPSFLPAPADFRGAAAALPPDPAFRAVRPRSAVEAAGEAAGVPLASRSATRVSARSTLTSTCFFNLIQSFDVESGRAGAGAPVGPAPYRRAV